MICQRGNFFKMIKNSLSSSIMMMKTRTTTSFSTFEFKNNSSQYIQQRKPNNNKKKNQKSNVIQTEFLYGINSVQAALHAKKRTIYEMYLSDSEMIQLNSKTMQLLKYAKAQNIPVNYLPKSKLDRMAGHSPHQNVIIKCSQLSFLKFEEITNFKFQDGIHVYTDKITDPQNFGAIVRSCVYFGVKTIFSGKKNHCPLNATVSKVSSGAIQLMSVSQVSNSEQFLQKWKQQNGIVMSTQTSNINKKVFPVQQLSVLKQQDNLSKILIILGSEGAGVSSHLKKYSDYNIFIERMGHGQYPYSLIDSLNVNAALTTILFELSKKIT